MAIRVGPGRARFLRGSQGRRAGGARGARLCAGSACLCVLPMISRPSQAFLATPRDAPADAEAASHRLLVRGGFIRQIGAGLWAMLPLGWRVHMPIEPIIREELDPVGGQEMRDPTLTPAELWETTG